MKIYNKRDFNAGLMFLAVALFFGFYAQDYSMGTATRMGPGYFPTLLAIIMGALGLIVLVMAFLKVEEQEPPEPTDYRGMGLILASVLAFGLILPYAGFLVAVFVLVAMAAAASNESKRIETVILAVALALLGVAVFGYGLELQFPVLPPSLTN